MTQIRGLLPRIRVGTHNQKLTTAAMQTAARKFVARRSYRVATHGKCAPHPAVSSVHRGVGREPSGRGRTRSPTRHDVGSYVELAGATFSKRN